MKTRLFILFLCMTLIACSIFSPPVSQESPRSPAEILAGVKPDKTAEAENIPTPTWEEILLDSAGDVIATSEPVARPDFPLPSIEPVIPLPPLADALSLPSGTVNVLLLGSDERGPFGGLRTDSLLLVSFHPKRGVVSVISFPRDLYVYIPGWTVRRINEAYQYGGFDSVADTFDYNFGVRPDYFVLVNFGAFEQAVDGMGGIDVNVGESLREGDYSVQPGVVHMDGEMALWYVRSRYTTSDFDRMRRQQEVLMATFERVISLDALKKAPQMYALYEESVTTNVGPQEVLAWVGVAKRIADTPETLQALTINQEFVTPYLTPAGGQVLLPKRDAIWDALNEMLIK
jgi:polyisoprenyl-teichoic acid--peptidoglycan teichoic acid transferase